MTVRLSAVAVMLWVGACPGAASAQLVGDGEPLSVNLHGFVSQGFILTTDNEYLASSSDGSFELTEAALNVTVPLSDRLRVGAQLFARDLGPLGNYSVKFDWFALDYRLADWLGIRAGRTKIPFGLYNEINDVDVARLPILLPQSVYPQQNRDYLLAQTGLELYGYLRLLGLGALDYRVYGGTIFLDEELAQDFSELEVTYVVGGRVMWEPPVTGLRLGGTVQVLKLEASLPLLGGLVHFDFPITLFVASVEYIVGGLLLAAEYGRWHRITESDRRGLFPRTSVATESLYAMASYRFNDWLQVGGYYSLTYPDIERRKGRANHQHDGALTVRFDVNDHWLLKLEGHAMAGTAVLSRDLNHDAPLGELTDVWAVFLAKTTVYF